jgi:hypothetical protein
MMRGLPVLFVLAAGCDSPFGDSPFGIAVTDAEVEAELECAALLYSWCRDADGDGQGTKEGIHPPMAACELLREAIAAGEGVICLPNEEECTNVDRYVNSCDDCDDNSADVYQSTPECDSSRDEIDNDCDGLIDEDHDVTTSYYADEDGDTYGDPNSMIEVSSCEDAPNKHVVDNFDCDDSDSTINPGQTDEGPCGDGIDQNCDSDPGDCALFQIDVAVSLLSAAKFNQATVAVALGTLNDDSFADFAVGLPDSKRVSIFFGGSRESLASEDPVSSSTIDGAVGFGRTLAAGNFAGDALMDLAVGAPESNTVFVYVYQDGAELTPDPASHGEFSSTVSGIGGAMSSYAKTDTNFSGLLIAYAEKTSSGTAENFWILPQPFVEDTNCLTGDICMGGFKTATDWPLALASATFGKTTYVGVGFSGGYGGLGPGLAVYKLNETTASLTLADSAISTSALGASVAFGTLSDGTSLVLVGAPGTVSNGKSDVGAVYMLSDLPSQIDADSTLEIGSPFWYSSKSNDQVGSAVALIGDVDRDSVDDSLVGDEELAIGGNGVLWIIAQQNASFPGGDLDAVASGKITGFKGIIRHIVNAGDVDGDGYSDLLISTDSTTYLLYGGYKPAQEDASDTGN